MEIWGSDSVSPPRPVWDALPMRVIYFESHTTARFAPFRSRQPRPWSPLISSCWHGFCSLQSDSSGGGYVRPVAHPGRSSFLLRHPGRDRVAVGLYLSTELWNGAMSILAWAAVILAVWLVVGFVVGTAIGRFIRAGAGPPLESSPEAAAQAEAPILHVVGEEHPNAALQRQSASGIG